MEFSHAHQRKLKLSRDLTRKYQQTELYLEDSEEMIAAALGTLDRHHNGVVVVDLNFYSSAANALCRSTPGQSKSFMSCCKVF